ncbi:MAG: SpoIID/LytB domain-containing protein [Clostridia bacterium]|nr:SpoIID/LytB domain-containing protein [Clostridia bacterium]
MKQPLWVKIFVWIFIVLMVGSCGSVLFYVFAPNASAAEPETSVSETYITAGLMYGSDVTVGFETVSTVGFAVHAATLGKTRTLTDLSFTIDKTKISVACDDNLSQSAGAYSIYTRKNPCVVGGWHIETADGVDTAQAAQELLAEVAAALLAEGSDMHPFIAYVDGQFRVRIGDYAAESKMEEKLGTIPKLAAARELQIVPPSKTGVSVIDPAKNEIQFEYDDNGKSFLALTALDKAGKKQYLRTPAGRLYDGAFVYSRYRTDAVDGIQLVNLLPLEDYICGVVPYEISPTWDYEALRAFAITVRSYTVNNLNRHAAYGFDICNTTHCQVYRGIGNANDNVYRAVESTRGSLLTYQGKPVVTYYSSSTGGYTAGGYDTWGGTVTPYLTPVATPWEHYAEYGNGLWVTEVDAQELADHLRSKGYSALTGKKITDIKINSFSGDSPYVYSITYTDSDGKSVTISRCDKVRTTISKYVNSANFLVGKGALAYDYDVVESVDLNSTYSRTQRAYAEVGEAPDVLTAGGVMESGEQKTYVMTATGAVNHTGELFVARGGDLIYESNETFPGVILTRMTKNYTAKDEDNFIFAGKGWGHGVGISQFGTLDLAKAGATAEQILALYFPNTEISTDASYFPRNFEKIEAVIRTDAGAAEEASAEQTPTEEATGEGAASTDVSATEAPPDEEDT